MLTTYYVNGEKIEINTNRKPFASGSEGKLYLIGDKLYKIYHPTALNEGFGNKKIYHQALLGLSNEFQSFVLPENLIFSEDGKYVGYVTKLIDKNKQKEGVTELDWNGFISNVRNLEIETDALSNKRFYLVDLGFHNSIFCRETKKLHMLDPGRYHHETFFTMSDYINRNTLILNDYFKRMLGREMHYFKLASNSKLNKVVNAIVAEKEDTKYSDYFEKIAQNYENPHDFIKRKTKYIR